MCFFFVFLFEPCAFVIKIIAMSNNGTDCIILYLWHWIYRYFFMYVHAFRGGGRGKLCDREINDRNSCRNFVWVKQKKNGEFAEVLDEAVGVAFFPPMEKRKLCRDDSRGMMPGWKTWWCFAEMSGRHIPRAVSGHRREAVGHWRTYCPSLDYFQGCNCSVNWRFPTSFYPNHFRR